MGDVMTYEEVGPSLNGRGSDADAVTGTIKAERDCIQPEINIKFELTENHRSAKSWHDTRRPRASVSSVVEKNSFKNNKSVRDEGTKSENGWRGPRTDFSPEKEVKTLETFGGDNSI